jgi:hypothetical protein
VKAEVDVDELEAGPELDALVAELMEPKPAPVSANSLRATYREWVWCSVHGHPSPGGWWEAEIGTDHGPPEDDDKPVTWVPAKEPSVEIAPAWEVVGALRAKGWIVRVQEMPDGAPFTLGAGWRPEENLELHRRAMCQLYASPALRKELGAFHVRDIVAFAEAAPLAICRAALKASKASEGK